MAPELRWPSCDCSHSPMSLELRSPQLQSGRRRFTTATPSNDKFKKWPMAAARDCVAGMGQWKQVGACRGQPKG